MKLRDGCLYMPETPGMGADVQPEYIRRYRID